MGSRYISINLTQRIIVAKMRKILLSIGLLAVMLPSVAKKNNNQVLMTVNGQDVAVSEFLYLYGKNTGQQQSKMTVDEYLDLFVVYKLKVVDAVSAGLDTIASFKNEYNSYRSELAKPYLKDQAAEDAMIAEAYEHKKREVDVSHIMVAKGKSPEENSLQVAKLDSIRTAVLGGADFGEAAQRHSIDRAVVRNKGHMGWLMADRVPYSFEKAAYDTPVGHISEVIETPFGYHIVRVENERPASGEVLAQHILKLTQGHPENDIPAIKSSIDSIYDYLISSGDTVDFNEVARRESEDPGSASKGGMLPWFGRGRMVPEFESVAFALNDGEISKPFKTSYGFHIIKKLGHKGVPALNEVRNSILSAMAKDGRLNEIAVRRMNQLRSVYNVGLYEANVSKIKDYIRQNNGLDSSIIAQMRVVPMPLGVVAGVNFTSMDILSAEASPVSTSKNAEHYIDELIDEYIYSRITELEITRLERENPEFRNLLKEYHDGILLFEISNRRVWEAASNDIEGLERYFDAHRNKYDFDSPKYKGYIVYSASDSIYNELNSIINRDKPGVGQLAEIISNKFKGDAKIEKVLVSKGENRLVDSIVFGGEKPELKGRFKYFTLYEGRVIDHPEEISDVRGNVIADYQIELEQSWIKELKSKYPVKINKKQLKKLR